MKLPLHEDYILTIASCSRVEPAVMADREEQRDAEGLWDGRYCSSASPQVTLLHSVHIIFSLLLISIPFSN